MIGHNLNSTPSLTEIGADMHRLMTEMYPICRSITGDGLRESLRIIQKHIPLELHEVPTVPRFSTGPYQRSGT